MKIYFYRYGSICEPDVIDSFKRLGLDVDEEIIEIRKKNLSPSECVSIVSPKLMNNNYTFVFTINFILILYLIQLTEYSSLTKCYLMNLNLITRDMFSIFHLQLISAVTMRL